MDVVGGTVVGGAVVAGGAVVVGATVVVGAAVVLGGAVVGGAVGGGATVVVTTTLGGGGGGVSRTGASEVVVATDPVGEKVAVARMSTRWTPAIVVVGPSGGGGGGVAWSSVPRCAQPTTTSSPAYAPIADAPTRRRARRAGWGRVRRVTWVGSARRARGLSGISPRRGARAAVLRPRPGPWCDAWGAAR